MPEVDSALKVGGHLVGISRLSSSGIFRNLPDLALKTGAGDGNRTRDLLFTKQLLCH